MNCFCEEDFLKKLAVLVNIDSGTGTVKGIENVADILSDSYSKTGLRVNHKVFDSRFGPCIEARNYPDDEQIDLLFIGHMDTVFPVGTAQKRPFYIQNGMAYGPGVADMKSGLLLGAELAAYLTKTRPDLRICIANNCDEEVGSVSSREWLKELARKSQYCLDFEPGRANGSFVSTRKGVARLAIRMYGISSHAGINPDDGASAILEMAQWICHINQQDFAPKGVLINFGTINGGNAYNVIPDYVESEVDIRYDIPEQLAAVLDLFHILQKAPFSPRVHVEIEEKSHIVPMVMNQNSKRFIKIFESAGQELNYLVRFVGTGGGSDASLVSSVGTATIDGCGLVGFYPHGEDEHVDITSIIKRLQFLINVCERLCTKS